MNSYPSQGSYTYPPPGSYTYPPQEIYYDEEEKSSFLSTFTIILIICFILYVLYLSNQKYFELGEKKETNLENNGDSNQVKNSIRFLDKQNIECPDQTGINRFKYVLGDANKFKYEYTCSKGGDLETAINNKSTDTNYDGDGKIQYLDRHEIFCGKDEVLNQFQLTRTDMENIRFDYKCIKSKSPLTCQDRNTQMTNIVNAEGIKVLKNISPTCGSDEALQKVQLITDNDNNTIKYNFTCCKY